MMKLSVVILFIFSFSYLHGQDDSLEQEFNIWEIEEEQPLIQAREALQNICDYFDLILDNETISCSKITLRQRYISLNPHMIIKREADQLEGSGDDASPAFNENREENDASLPKESTSSIPNLLLSKHSTVNKIPDNESLPGENKNQNDMNNTSEIPLPTKEPFKKETSEKTPQQKQNNMNSNPINASEIPLDTKEPFEKETPEKTSPKDASLPQESTSSIPNLQNDNESLPGGNENQTQQKQNDMNSNPINTSEIPLQTKEPFKKGTPEKTPQQKQNNMNSNPINATEIPLETKEPFEKETPPKALPSDLAEDDSNKEKEKIYDFQSNNAGIINHPPEEVNAIEGSESEKVLQKMATNAKEQIGKEVPNVRESTKDVQTASKSTSVLIILLVIGLLAAAAIFIRKYTKKDQDKYQATPTREKNGDVEQGTELKPLMKDNICPKESSDSKNDATK